MSQFIFYSQRVTQRAFTLVETLVAVSILLVVIIGPITIAQKGLKNAYYAEEQTVAIYLAQEAISHMQLLRDNVALAEYESVAPGDTWEWYDDLDSACKISTGDNIGCDYDVIDGVYQDCTSPSNCRLDVFTATGTVSRVYGYSDGATGWEPSVYNREIRVSPPVNTDDAAMVTVIVEWNSSLFNTDRQVILRTYIYNHYTRFGV